MSRVKQWAENTAEEKVDNINAQIIFLGFIFIRSILDYINDNMRNAGDVLMRRPIFIFWLVFIYIWSFSIFNAVKASDYNKAVIGHVISETIKGTDIDKSAILEQELHNLAHRYTIEMLNIIQTHLPDILDGIAADLRLQADKKRKEELLNAKKN